MFIWPLTARWLPTDIFEDVWISVILMFTVYLFIRFLFFVVHHAVAVAKRLLA
ncbi:MAG TPA: hypothetical protein PKD69_06490 [Elusimicrobiota bacterium]|nr:hypothetical protein [Elusimicrobiota bacterium]